MLQTVYWRRLLSAPPRVRRGIRPPGRGEGGDDVGCIPAKGWIRSKGGDMANPGASPAKGSRLLRLSRAVSAPVLEKGREPIPGYRLRRYLGRGSFGQVWEADTVDGQSLAMKFLSCESGTQAGMENQSIQMVRQLEHPGLIR